jgi:RiboL-PSP-HEPN
MPNTAALNEFRESLGRARKLLSLEVHLYSDPPKSNQREQVAALREGATVLSVAALEKYLRDVFEEVIDDIVAHPLYSFGKLPQNLQYHGISESLNWSIRGEPYAKKRDKTQKIIDIIAAANIVNTGVIQSKVFAHTRSNPNSETVKDMMSAIDVNDYFKSIKVIFERKFGKPIHRDYIKETLDSIIERRHIVAHTATSNNITRQDLRKSFRFLRLFCEICDLEIRKKSRAIKGSF